jgi:hypothetical protein
MTQTIHEIAFDEAGNTGADLLRTEQPVFALASVSLSRSEADEILAGLRTAQTRETKFSQLRKSEAGRRRLLNFLSSPQLTSDRIITTFVHKKFMVVAKIVDLLTETLAHESGVDLHKDGANIALSNLHFNCMATFCGADWTETFLRRFVEMMRQRTTKSIKSFYAAARVLYAISKSSGYADVLLPILASERLIGKILATNNKNSLDPAIPTFIQHCVFWGERFGETFDLVHDSSKPIFQEKDTLEELMSRGEEEHLVGYGSRTFIFPLRASGIKFDKSENDPRLQVADLLAGACANWAAGSISAPQDQGFYEGIAAGVSRFALNAIWPTADISPQALGAEDDGGVNAINHIAEFLSMHRR